MLIYMRLGHPGDFHNNADSDLLFWAHTNT